MKKILLAMLIASSLQCYTQEFAPVGAIWHYTQKTINPDLISFKTFESISDTIINGIQCYKIIEVGRYTDTVSVNYHYMYSKNDSVFFFADNDFHLLYDFGAMAGDTIILDYFPTFDGSPLKMIIDSTASITINNEMRKIQYITSGDGLVVEFGRHVIAGIGNTSFMFPRYDLSLDGPLRCYEDSITGLFINPYHPDYWWGQLDCEQILTGIGEINPTNRVVAFPNPTSHSIFITNIDQPTAYSIFDIYGNLLKNGTMVTSNEIRMDGLPKGIYFLVLKNEDLLTLKKIIKK